MTTTATIKARPLILRDEEVRLLLDAGEVRVRRVIFKDNDPDCHMPWRVSGAHWKDGDEMLRCPFGEVGDIRWVKEVYAIDPWYSVSGKVAIESEPDEVMTTKVYFKADGGRWRETSVQRKILARDVKSGHCGWNPARSMPHWASRLSTVTISTAVVRAESGTWEWDGVLRRVDEVTKGD